MEVGLKSLYATQAATKHYMLCDVTSSLFKDLPKKHVDITYVLEVSGLPLFGVTIRHATYPTIFLKRRASQNLILLDKYNKCYCWYLF